MLQNKVELRLDPAGIVLAKKLKLHNKQMKIANARDWDSEYSSLCLSVKIVASVQEAIEHINTHGSKHTDAIITENKKAALDFMRSVDSSSVMVNASTRFADGFRYGKGAEVGISTSKIHARGPVGLEGLISYKYVVVGSGDVVSDFSSGQRKFTQTKLNKKLGL